MNLNGILRIVFSLIFAGFMVVMSSPLHGEIIDRIAVVVGDEIILESEVNQLVMQQREYGRSTLSDEELRKSVLENLLSSKILYDVAVKDTNIVVEDEDVEMRLDSEIKNILNRIGGEEVLVSRYNITLSKLKNDKRKEIRKSLFVNKLKRNYLGKVEVSRNEVERFFETYQDSLPLVKASVTLIELVCGFTSEDDFSLGSLKKAQQIREDIVSGKLTFEEAAKKYSEDSSAENGGDLGYSNRGDFVPEFEAVAYNLSPGEISEPVKSQFGYHIIKLIEKNGDKIRSSHILIKKAVSAENYEAARKKAELLADSLNNRNFTFEEAIQKYSDKEESKRNNGFVGVLELADMTEEFRKIFQDLKVGEITEPVKNKDGYYLYKVIDKQSDHKVDLTTDYSKLKDWTLARKRDKELKKWVEELKKKVYIELK